MNFANFNVHGPDVSFYQDADGTPQQIDFHKMKAAGAEFVIIKAGQRFYTDPDFIYNWKEAKAAGLPRGSYWFYDSREDPKTQAQKYWSLLQNDPGELFHAADWEENYGGQYREWQYFYDFLWWFQDISKIAHQYIPVYTNYFYWMEHAPTNPISLAWFNRHPLWLAGYGTQLQTRVPAPWTECILWQYGTPSVGLQYGAESREIDMNIWNGDLESFKRYFGLSGTTEPPTEPETGETMIGKVLVNLNIRPTASTQYAYIGQLAPNDIVEGTVTNGWWKLTKWTRGSVTMTLPRLECYAYEGATQGYIQTITQPPEPPVVTFPEFITAHFPDGVTKKYVPE